MKVKKKLLNLIRSAFEYFFFFLLSFILIYWDIRCLTKTTPKIESKVSKVFFFFLVGNLPKRFVAYYYIRWHLSFSATYIDQYRKTLVFCFRPLMSMLQLASIFFSVNFCPTTNQTSNQTRPPRREFRAKWSCSRI